MKINFFSFEWFPLLTTVILHDRIAWSIRLRWLAIAGFFTATMVTKYVLFLDVPYTRIWMSLGGLAVFNASYYVVLKLFKRFTFISELIVLHVHIFVDLFFLTLIVHFAGGIENPVYLFYVFHVVISSILFPGLIPLVFATMVVILFGGLVYLEFTGMITHYCVFETGIHDNPVAIYTTFLVFTITVYVSAYICMTFMQVYRNTKRAIDAQNRQLIENDRKKSQFYRYTSHELKSPIIAIKTTVDTVIKSYQRKLDEKGVNLLQRASSRASQMLDILKELLELSKNHIMGDDQTAELLDINEMIRETIHEQKQLIEGKSLKVSMELDAKAGKVRGIRVNLHTALGNLLNNAVHYTEERGRVKINTRVENGKLIIRYEDNGIGIPEEDLKRVFDEFYRSANARQMVKFGTGLGLSLVRKIIEDHHGSISVESKVDQGTVFIVRLPLKG